MVFSLTSSLLFFMNIKPIRSALGNFFVTSTQPSNHF